MKSFLNIFFLLFFLQNIHAQDVHFSQFYANRLYLNPALAGASYCPHVSLSYRNQWPGLTDAFISYATAYDQYVKALHGGIGLQIIRDQQSSANLNITNIDLMYAFKFQLNRKIHVSMAVQSSVFQQELNWSNLIFPDMIDPLQGAVLQTTELESESPNYYIDFSTGVAAFIYNYYFGIAVHHINHFGRSTQNNEYNYLPAKYTCHFGTTIAIDNHGLQKKYVYLSPNLIYQKQGSYQQLNYGIYITYKYLVAGIWARQKIVPDFETDAIIVLLGFDLKKTKFAYNYDITLSKLRKGSGGAHEISLSYQFECFEKIKKAKAISCPRF